MALREKSQNKAGRPCPVDPARAQHQSDGMTLPSNPAGVQQESSMGSAPETGREGRPRQDVLEGPPAWPLNWSHWCAAPSGRRGSWLGRAGKGRHGQRCCRTGSPTSSPLAPPSLPALPCLAPEGGCFSTRRCMSSILLVSSSSLEFKTLKTPPTPGSAGLRLPAPVQKKSTGVENITSPRPRWSQAPCSGTEESTRELAEHTTGSTWGARPAGPRPAEAGATGWRCSWPQEAP